MSICPYNGSLEKPFLIRPYNGSLPRYQGRVSGAVAAGATLQRSPRDVEPPRRSGHSECSVREEEVPIAGGGTPGAGAGGGERGAQGGAWSLFGAPAAAPREGMRGAAPGEVRRGAR